MCRDSFIGHSVHVQWIYSGNTHVQHALDRRSVKPAGVIPRVYWGWSSVRLGVSFSETGWSAMRLGGGRGRSVGLCSPRGIPRTAGNQFCRDRHSDEDLAFSHPHHTHHPPLPPPLPLPPPPPPLTAALRHIGQRATDRHPLRSWFSLIVHVIFLHYES